MQTPLYKMNEEKKREWTDKVYGRLSGEQKEKLTALVLYMYPFFAVWKHNKVSIWAMSCVILRYVKDCPFDTTNKKLFFKPLRWYTKAECLERFGPNWENMSIELGDPMPEMSVEFLKS